jgi:hypothetical protein
VLLEAADVESSERVRASGAYQALYKAMRDAARNVFEMAARNVTRIGPVDHSRDGVFLFNFFVADNAEQNLAVWHYTAGWFQQETGLDNSTVLLPMAADRSPYTIINHFRWNRLRDILPALIFKRSFARMYSRTSMPTTRRRCRFSTHSRERLSTMNDS